MSVGEYEIFYSAVDAERECGWYWRTKCGWASAEERGHRARHQCQIRRAAAQYQCDCYA